MILCGLELLYVKIATRKPRNTRGYKEGMEKEGLEESSVDSNSINILSSPEHLLTLYTEVSSNAKYVVERIWANARFFSTATSALLAVTVASIASIETAGMQAMKNPAITALLCLLPAMVVAMSMIGVCNLRREYKRFLDWVTVIDKLQEKLGLYKRTQFRKYTHDKYLLPERFAESSVQSARQFVENALQRRGSLYYYFRLLHIIYAGLGLVAVIVIVLRSTLP